MVSFKQKLVKGLTERGLDVCHDLEDTPYDAILVIGGTRRLAGLWRAHRSGIPIVQRLDGMNWLQRVCRTGLRHFLRAEWGNWLLRTIRARYANIVVYQSAFARAWWEREYGATKTPCHVVLNGVDLNAYTPVGPGQRPTDRYRLLLVEGTLGGGYELGLEHALTLAEAVDARTRLPVELMVVGRVTPALRDRIDRRAQVPVHWTGRVPPERIPEFDRSAHVLYSADLNSACPNAVIEALACGLPVVAFETGALPELVTSEAGSLTPYGGDPWRLDHPDFANLTEAALLVLEHQARFRSGARKRAENGLDLGTMVNGYLSALGWA
jgi:glycosyltransferase involved in cell wall biosynthesis